MGLLSLAIWMPIIIGVGLLALGRESQVRIVRWIALIGSVASFLVTLPLYDGFQLGTSAMQFVEKSSWIQRFNVNYHLGVDGLSLWLVLLTAFINVIVVIAGWEVITKRVNQYMASFMILSGLMIGVFVALDGMLFYVFFEATLIPMYLIIGIWGGPNKIGSSYLWAAQYKRCYFLHFLRPLLSRCRCGLSIPGCPTFTSRRLRAALLCWRPSCSSSALTVSCGFPCPYCPTHRANGHGS